MLRNTVEIINACSNAVKDYEKLCKGFFGAPGEEGRNRKLEFQKLIDGLQRNTPEEAFIKIYNFYSSNKPTSRLNKLIESELKWVLCIPEPKLTGIASRDMREILKTNNDFHEKASLIQDKMGITEENEYLLMNL